jgi:Family of unknown function (DUF5343)
VTIVPSGRTAAYAPPAAVIEVIDRYRNRGLSKPFTPEVLERAGVSPTLTRRTIASLKQLGFIDADGNPTPEFEAATRAPEQEFKELLGNLLTATYSDVLAFADPGKDSFDRVRDAFRGIEPRGQHDRMVTLFLGLMDYIGADTTAATASRKTGGPVKRAPMKMPAPNRSLSRRSVGKTDRRDSGRDGAADDVGSEGLPPGLLGLLHQIPRDGAGWPRARRDEFMAAFSAVLDFTIPVREREPAPIASDDAEGEAR